MPADAPTSRSPENAHAFTCPCCGTTLTVSRAEVGSELNCSSCGELLRVPRPKLSVKGKLPIGIQVHQSQPQQASAPSPAPVSQPLPLPPQPAAVQDDGTIEGKPTILKPILLGLLVIVLIGAGGAGVWFAFSSTDPSSVPEPSLARPAAENVYADIDFIYQKLQAVEFARQAIDEDLMVTLAALQNLPTAETTMAGQIQIVKDAIAARETRIRQDKEAAIISMAKLAQQNQQWPDFMKQLFEAKIDETQSRPDRYRLVSEIVAEISSVPSDVSSTEDYLRSRYN